MKKLLPLAFLLLAGLWACRRGTDEDGRPPEFYRNEMRLFVQAISTYTRKAQASFLVIPQNGHELLTQNGRADGEAATDYVRAISGLGREDLFYGYNGDDEPTPPEIRDGWLAFMGLAERQGLEVMAIDYCRTPAHVDNSFRQNCSRGYISFAAVRELDSIPVYPATPYRLHSGPVSTLAQARNFLYLINPRSFPDKASFLNALRQTSFDLLVIDLFFDASPLTAADIISLKAKAQSGSRLVLCYLSIGEAEDYRYYWQSSWKSSPPSWLEKENSDWPGNFKVRFWDKDWQDIIYGNNASYIKKILDAGFDGIYLDLIDAYEYWEEKR